MRMNCEQCLADHEARLNHVLSERDQQERALRFAAGMISTQPGWSDKHPEEAFKFITDEKNFMSADVAS